MPITEDDIQPYDPTETQLDITRQLLADISRISDAAATLADTGSDPVDLDDARRLVETASDDLDTLAERIATLADDIDRNNPDDGEDGEDDDVEADEGLQ